MKMIKMGMWIKNKRGVYVVDSIEDRFVILRDVFLDDKGAIIYGNKKRFIGIEDLDNYSMA